MIKKNILQSENKKVGKLIRKVREKRGFTLSDLSDRTGIALQTLSKYELGDNTPTLKQLDRIADGLGCSRCTICPHHYKHEDN